MKSTTIQTECVMLDKDSTTDAVESKSVIQEGAHNCSFDLF